MNPSDARWFADVGFVRADGVLFRVVAVQDCDVIVERASMWERLGYWFGGFWYWLRKM
jgi:hypothetical protein